MKRSTVLLFILVICNNVIICQVVKDTLANNFIYVQSYNYFSAEESWQINKEAYNKQLVAKGLSYDEIEKKMSTYESNKSQFIIKINELKKLADEQRQIEKETLRKAEEQRSKADIIRSNAEKQRQMAEIIRSKAEDQRKLADLKRQDDALRNNKNKLSRQSDSLFRKADALFKEADEIFLQFDEQRKIADRLFDEADEKRQIAEEWRNSFDNVLTREIKLTGTPANINPIVFKAKKKTTLMFNIDVIISSGTTLIEIINPSGEIEGELTMEHNYNSTGIQAESTSGSLNKTISDAQVGDWRIRVLSNDSNGTVNLSVAQFQKSATDE